MSKKTLLVAKQHLQSSNSHSSKDPHKHQKLMPLGMDTMMYVGIVCSSPWAVCLELFRGFGKYMLFNLMVCC